MKEIQMDRIKITEYKTRGGMNVGAAVEKLYHNIMKGDTDEEVSTALDLYRTRPVMQAALTKQLDTAATSAVGPG